MDIVLENIIVGKADTTANWGADTTVYSLGFFMISSDATYSGTNVKKWKIANGVDTWTNIDFVPVAETLAKILLKDNKTGGEPIHSDDEYSVLKVLNNEIALFIDDGATGGANFLGDYTRAKMRFVEYATFKTGEINIDISRTYIKHSDLIELTAPSVKINNDEALAYKWYNDVNANSNGIINLRDAVAPQEPITKSQFDSYNASVGRQRGAIDCSSNPNYPASNVGDRWEVSVAGKIGGASGITVQVYDEIVCKTDSASGDQATVGMNFYVIQGNLERASETVSGYTQYATDAEVQAGTENTKTFTPLKLTNWWSYIKGIANTWALKQTFTTAPRLSSNSASTPLAVDSNKDVSDLTDSIWGAFLNGLTGKTTPVDTDSIGIVDSADSNKSKKLTFTNLKAFLKTYFDTQYQSGLLFKQNATITHTGTLTPTVIASFALPIGFNQANDFVKIWGMAGVDVSGGAVGNNQIRFYIGPNPTDIIGAQHIATMNNTTTLRTYPIGRTMVFKNSLTDFELSATQADYVQTDYATNANAPTLYSIDFTTQKYFHVVGILTNTGNIISIRSLYAQLMR